MMNEQQISNLSDARLFIKIAEEASEVIKAICKHAQFGGRPLFEDVQYNNINDVNEEYFQLQTLIYEYRKRFGLK